jgi:hypothetical protein
MVDRAEYAGFVLKALYAGGIAGEGFGQTLIATSRAKRVSRAIHSPMPPAPIDD